MSSIDIVDKIFNHYAKPRVVLTIRPFTERDWLIFLTTIDLCCLGLYNLSTLPKLITYVIYHISWCKASWRSQYLVMLGQMSPLLLEYSDLSLLV